MRVLVAYSSRHGGTEGIAHAIAAVLGGAPPEDGADLWCEVDVMPAADVEDVEDYDAVVVGSAVYAGHWLEAARSFVVAHREALAGRPVWLFSSGPVGDTSVPADEAVEPPALSVLVDAQDHRTFAGRLRSAALALPERAGVRPVHANDGDYRDWDAIRAWAAEISESLGALAARG